MRRGRQLPIESGEIRCQVGGVSKVEGPIGASCGDGWGNETGSAVAKSRVPGSKA